MAAWVCGRLEKASVRSGRVGSIVPSRLPGSQRLPCESAGIEGNSLFLPWSHRQANDAENRRDEKGGWPRTTKNVSSAGNIKS